MSIMWCDTCKVGSPSQGSTIRSAINRGGYRETWAAYLLRCGHYADKNGPAPDALIPDGRRPLSEFVKDRP